MNSVQEINAEILRLQNLRDAITESESSSNEYYIKSLVWTKDCIAKLNFCSFATYGLPKYEILILGKAPEHKGVITILGTSPFYQHNLSYKNPSSQFSLRNEYPNFFTDSSVLLIEFLKTTCFKKLEYNTELLQVLEAARNHGE